MSFRMQQNFGNGTFVKYISVPFDAKNTVEETAQLDIYIRNDCMDRLSFGSMSQKLRPLYEYNEILHEGYTYITSLKSIAPAYLSAEQRLKHRGSYLFELQNPIYVHSHDDYMSFGRIHFAFECSYMERDYFYFHEKYRKDSWKLILDLLFKKHIRESCIVKELLIP
jgi:hypothetical protein